MYHGGGGTTGHALRAGVPVVTTPAIADQPFWAGRLVRIGVSPGFTPMRRLTAQRLADLITQAVSEPAYRQRAQIVAEQVRAEDGAGQIVPALER